MIYFELKIAAIFFPNACHLIKFESCNANTLGAPPTQRPLPRLRREDVPERNQRRAGDASLVKPVLYTCTCT